VIGETPSDSREILDDGDAERGEEVRGSNSRNLEELRGSDYSSGKDDFLSSVDGVGSSGSRSGELDSGRGSSIEDDFRSLISRENDEVRSIVDGIEVASFGVRSSPLERGNEDELR
jgi:hypothetical protein